MTAASLVGVQPPACGPTREEHDALAAAVRRLAATLMWSRGDQLVDVPAPQIRKGLGEAIQPLLQVQTSDRNIEQIVDVTAKQTRKECGEVFQPTPQERTPDRIVEQAVDGLDPQIQQRVIEVMRRNTDCWQQRPTEHINLVVELLVTQIRKEIGEVTQPIPKILLPTASVSKPSTFQSHRLWSLPSKS